MVLAARLHIDGHEQESDGIPLLYCSYFFSQNIDQRGLPKSEVKGGLINLTFHSLDDQEIMHWMVSAKADKNGKIIFAGDENAKAFKTIEFKDARCVSYHESFIRDGSMTIDLTISARELTISGVTHKNIWTKYD